jgi:hypothetical protein
VINPRFSRLNPRYPLNRSYVDLSAGLNVGRLQVLRGLVSILFMQRIWKPTCRAEVAEVEEWTKAGNRSRDVGETYWTLQPAAVMFCQMLPWNVKRTTGRICLTFGRILFCPYQSRPDLFPNLLLQIWYLEFHISFLFPPHNKRHTANITFFAGSRVPVPVAMRISVFGVVTLRRSQKVRCFREIYRLHR